MSDPNATPPSDSAAGGSVPPTGASSSATPLTPAEDKQWASFAYFGNIILLVPALIIYLVFKDRGTLVRQEAKEALNWTINVTGLVIVANILMAIFIFIPNIGGILALIVQLAYWALLIVNLVLAIIAGMRVNSGGTYRYPFNMRWIK